MPINIFPINLRKSSSVSSQTWNLWHCVFCVRLCYCMACTIRYDWSVKWSTIQKCLPSHRMVLWINFPHIHWQIETTEFVILHAGLLSKILSACYISKVKMIVTADKSNLQLNVKYKLWWWVWYNSYSKQ